MRSCGRWTSNRRLSTSRERRGFRRPPGRSVTAAGGPFEAPQRARDRPGRSEGSTAQENSVPDESWVTPGTGGSGPLCNRPFSPLKHSFLWASKLS